jgi:hypothetical protein
VVAFSFQRTAQAGALLILVGCAGLVVASLADAPVGVISLTCAVIGSGLGPSSISQVLAVQHAAEERVRGVATSLVPFFRAIGGALGVGALGGILAAGLTVRLGSAANRAGSLLAGGRAPEAIGVSPEALRLAIEGSLVPIFLVLTALAAVNFVAASFFPRSAERAARADDPGRSG